MKTLIVASLIGMSVGQFGAPVFTQAPESEREIETLRAAPTTTTLRLSGSTYRSAEANADIAESVDTAATNIDDALAQAPSVAYAMAQSINDHGPVRAILYEDPAVKAAADGMGASLGRGLRALGDAIRRDMVEGARHVSPQG